MAASEPEWLADWVPFEWFDRYAIRFEDTRLPKWKAKQTELIGADGLSLLGALNGPDAPPTLRLLDQVKTLRQMWIQQYFLDDGQVRRRDLKALLWRTPPIGLGGGGSSAAWPRRARRVRRTAGPPPTEIN
ncbi:hypothetical protein ACIQRW_05465 [Streptomyces sp. NPDC091287]|uniref:hypothetical protein n=1 Tax=Streptomyces sp. NPDC091287 TaxID=3365988 RepID=UPI003827A295